MLFRSRNFTDDAHLSWDNATKVLKVGTENVLTKMSYKGTVANDDTGDIVLNRITLDVGNRSAQTTEAVITGMDINFSSIDPNNLTNFGRLGHKETAIGLHVDMSSLIANYEIADNAFKGYKYAAAFRGGNVGVGVEYPQAGLHIVQTEGQPSLLVEHDTGTDVNSLFTVLSDGNVGVGLKNPEQKFAIQGESGSALFAARYNTGIPILFEIGRAHV